MQHAILNFYKDWKPQLSVVSATLIRKFYQFCNVLHIGQSIDLIKLWWV